MAIETNSAPTADHVAIARELLFARPSSKDIQLSPDQRDDRTVLGDLAEAAGDPGEAEMCRTEASIGARVVRGPGDHGYNPMLALMGAQMGMSHDPRIGRLSWAS